MVISHGAGGQASRFAEKFSPYAASYNIVMLFP